jgi:hypothetical protein
VTEFMTELVGELRPIALANVDDDPAEIGFIRLQPDRGIARRVLVDTQARGLTVGDQANALEAGGAHPLHHLPR